MAHPVRKPIYIIRTAYEAASVLWVDGEESDKEDHATSNTNQGI